MPEPSQPTSPTFLFIPGGWHFPAYFAPLANALANAGYASETVTLNVNADPPLQDLESEIHAILAKLLPLLEAGKQVIVVAHSYGGIPATEAVGRIATSPRLGIRGSVLRLVYMAAFVPGKGDSMVGMIEGFDESLDPALISFGVSCIYLVFLLSSSCLVWWMLSLVDFYLYM